MTALDLPAIRALHAGITPGPWESVPCDIYPTWILGAPQDGSPYAVDVLRVDSDGYSGGLEEADAAFIAAAPSIVTQLLGVVEAQQKALDALMYVANHKAADDERGRWWAEVIRGPIIRHLGAEEAAKLGTITGEGQ